MESDANRKFLYGISLFARLRANWNVHFIDPRDLTVEALQLVSNSGIDAIFAKEDAMPVIQAYFGNNLPPTAVFGTPNKGQPINGVDYFSVNGTAIGTQAAEYFLSLGKFSSFGFYTEDLDQSFVHDRREGFTSRLSADGFPISVCTACGNLQKTITWLSTLPKPTAVFCANINYAIKLIESCKVGGFKIRKQIAILGVDDDELFGGFIKPRPSTIAIPYEKLGMEAAKAIARRLKYPSMKIMPGKPYAMSDMQVIEYGSSTALSPAAHLVYNSIEFIKQNARRHISVGDVAKHVGTSRKLLELRFREIRNETILSHIHRVRLNEVCTELTFTEKTIQNISRDCGFTNLTYLKTFFRRQLGMTMTEYRAKSLDDYD